VTTRLNPHPPKRYVQRMEARTAFRERIARHRAAQRERGLRPVVLWLPDVNDPAYRARLAEECRRLAQLTPDEDAMASGFAHLAEQTGGWR
jgi:hypothetical protein